MAKKCPACGARFRGWPGRSRHHLVPKGQGGDDVLANLVIIDGSGTTGCHGKLHGGGPKAREVRVALRNHLEKDRPECIAYIKAKKGEPWLEKNYPLR